MRSSSTGDSRRGSPAKLRVEHGGGNGYGGWRGVPARRRQHYQFWPYTRHIGKLGVLDRWIQTPSNHRVHHAQNDIYLGRNYIGVFLLWYHLCGTFEEEREDEPCIYGVRLQLKSWNPVWANLQ